MHLASRVFRKPRVDCFARDLFFLGLPENSDPNLIKDFESIRKAIDRGYELSSLSDSKFNSYVKKNKEVTITSHPALILRTKKHILSGIKFLTDRFIKLGGHSISFHSIKGSKSLYTQNSVSGDNALRAVSSRMMGLDHIFQQEINRHEASTGFDYSPLLDKRVRYEDMLVSEKRSHLQGLLLKKYRRISGNFSCKRISWSRVSVRGWPINMDLKLSDATMHQLDGLKQKLDDGSVEFFDQDQESH